MVRRVFFCFLAAFFACVTGVTPCAPADDAKQLFGLAAFPGATGRVETIGAMPLQVMGDVPTPAGMAPLGGVTASRKDGTLYGEVLYYAAPVGTVPDLVRYASVLTQAGWTRYGPQLPFSFGSGTQMFCKSGSSQIMLSFETRFLIVRANAQGCPGSLAHNMTVSLTKAPLPEFSAPDRAIFLGSAKQTINGNSQVASIVMDSNETAVTLVTALSQQMTKAGWKPIGGASSDAESFSARDNNNVDWATVISVVSIGPGHYLFTVSSFKQSEIAVGRS